MEVYEYNQVKPILTDIQKITNILLKLPNSVTNAINDDLYLFYKNLCRDLFINFKFTKYQDFERYLNYEALKANKPLEDHMRTLITNYDTYADFVAKASHTLSYDKSIDYGCRGGGRGGPVRKTFTGRHPALERASRRLADIEIWLHHRRPCLCLDLQRRLEWLRD